MVFRMIHAKDSRSYQGTKFGRLGLSGIHVFILDTLWKFNTSPLKNGGKGRRSFPIGMVPFSGANCETSRGYLCKDGVGIIDQANWIHAHLNPAGEQNGPFQRSQGTKPLTAKQTNNIPKHLWLKKQHFIITYLYVRKRNKTQKKTWQN